MSVNDSEHDIGQEKMFEYLNSLRILYLTGYSIICSLGLVLNTSVVVASCCIYHKTRMTDTGEWVLALAVTHLICSAFLPLQSLYAWFHFNWHWGTVLCKFSSCVFYASMFSTAAMLSLWSISDSLKRNKCIKRCSAKLWGHGQSWVIILISVSCTFGIVLSVPSLYSRELRNTQYGKRCIDDFDLDDKKTTKDGWQSLIIVVVFRFVLGILLPGFLMGITRCLSRGQTNGVKRLNRITCCIKVAYFVCWAPLLILYTIQVVTSEKDDTFNYKLPATTVLAAAHCCINPVIYLLVGCDVKMKWLSYNSHSTNQRQPAESVPLR